MIKAVMQYEFLQNAVVSSLLAGIICGIIGVIIVEKKLLMMSGGIAHTAYGGVGLSMLLGFEPLIGAGIFSVLSAFVIGGVRRKNSAHTDIIIALLWSFGMALGIAFIGLMPGYPPDMNSYLFGNILTVTKKDIYIMTALTLIVVALIFIFWADWKSYLFDNLFAKVNGSKTAVLEYMLFIIIALSIVALMRVVGIILVIALLTAPAACAALLSKKLFGRMIISGILCCAFCVIGLTVSYYFEIPSSATIVFVSVLTCFILKCLKK